MRSEELKAIMPSNVPLALLENCNFDEPKID